MRSLHVGFLMLLTFVMLPGFGRRHDKGVLIGTLLGVVGFALGFYHWIFEEELIVRSGDLTQLDIAVGIVTLVLVFEATRRMMGAALPLICAVFLAYALWGNYLPGALAHRGFGLDQVINQMSFGTEGIYGIPTYVSSTYIFLFILFGTFLEQAGMIRLFTDFSMGTWATRAADRPRCRRRLGADGHDQRLGRGQRRHHRPVHDPADEALRLQGGLRRGVEATSSMGGQIMPPVMGRSPSSWPRRSACPTSRS